MPGLFLSYRRAESDYAVLMYAWLAERFGPAQVFWDREDIEPGNDFRNVLSTHLNDCQALVALIGPNWSPSPWIQKEIGAALKRKILVLPVLVGETPNLSEDALPKPIRMLANLQTVETRDLRFRDRLMTALAKVVTSTPAPEALDEVRVRRLTTLLQSQCDRRQVEALQLLQRGDLDQASDVLNETFELLMTLLEFNPGDPEIEVRLGYLYKDLAQVFESSDPARARRHIQTGLQLFEGLVSRQLSTDVEASAVNGLGNMYLMSGDYQRAIEHCRRATVLMPDYANAWADLFLAYAGQAESGQPDIKAMQEVMGRLKAAARGDSLLEPVLPEYQRMLDDAIAAGGPRTGGTSAPTSTAPSRQRSTRAKPRRA